jgi:hypothetical protein
MGTFRKIWNQSLAKVGVEGSNPFARSKISSENQCLQDDCRRARSSFLGNCFRSPRHSFWGSNIRRTVHTANGRRRVPRALAMSEVHRLPRPGQTAISAFRERKIHEGTVVPPPSAIGCSLLRSHKCRIAGILRSRLERVWIECRQRPVAGDATGAAGPLGVPKKRKKSDFGLTTMRVSPLFSPVS